MGICSAVVALCFVGRVKFAPACVGANVYVYFADGGAHQSVSPLNFLTGHTAYSKSSCMPCGASKDARSLVGSSCVARLKSNYLAYARLFQQ